MDVKQKLHAWFEWYLVNQDSLVEKYNGKFLVIKDFEVVGVYDDRSSAYFDALEKYGLGNFMTQLCTPGEDAYTIYTARPFAL